ncbi:MAG TPA: adenosine deaminase [Candidatus Baltobacteraceae bacterium]|jgi:adenosine deaminase|nr:adenosine deaminase [Candidatus Baltobacteraceae bacterium]
MIDAVVLPKAELHVHVEGTLEPELLFKCAERHKLQLEYANVDALRAAYRFSGLSSFLKLYYQAMSVLRHEQDFYDLTTAYLKRAVSQGVRHAEIFFDPQAHNSRGVALDIVVEGISQALRDGERDLGVSALLIPCFLRDKTPESAAMMLQSLLRYKDRFVGIGLDSAEMGNPPSKFAAVFHRAKAEGLRLVCHAGEEGSPEYVWDAIQVLEAERIDHGVRSMEDLQLVEYLRQEQIPLTVCPLSNVRLHVVPSLAMHPLKRMLDAGLMVTCNSDDPAYFGGYVGDNFARCADALRLTTSETITLARNSFNASFIGDAAKRGFLDELDAYVASVATPSVMD